MRKLKTLSAINTFIKADESDTDLPEKYIGPLKSVVEQLKFRDDIYVYETLKGFIIEGKVPVIPVSNSIELDPKSLMSLYSLKGLRKVRFKTPLVQIHLEH
jgi:hypothetical protein